MVLELLISAVYQVVKSSWELSVFLVKFFVLAVFLELAYRRNLNLTSFVEEVVKYGRPMVAFLVAGGSILALTGVEVPILYRILGELVAVGYFGLLFWKY